MLSLSGISPNPGENLVSLDSVIEFTLVDDGTGIDLSSIIVELKGFRALTGLNFTEEFLGTNSNVILDGNDYVISIDPINDFNLGKVYDVKIQAKNLLGEYFNYTYSFKTIPLEPVLVLSSPHNNQILRSPQILFLEFDDVIEAIDLNSISISVNGLRYISAGVVQPGLSGALTDVRIEDTKALIRIDPVEAFKTGEYVISYRVSDVSGNLLVGKIDFKVLLKEVVLPKIFPQTGFLGYYQGLDKAKDIGKGDSLLLSWNVPVKREYKNDIFVLVYENEFRLKVFDRPKYLGLSTIQEAEINNLNAGITLSYGARALEIATGILDPEGMILIAPDFYLLPEPTEIVSQFNVEDLILRVESVEGYPEAGLLFVGREVIRYTSLNRIENTFSIPVNGRGLVNTIPGIYLSGDTVDLFTKCTDENTVIAMATPTHQDGYGLDRFLEGEGIVVSDFSDNDQTFFQGFDFCGWHDPRPDQTLNGINDCGSYLGGEFNGFRGFSLVDRLLSQEEVLLTTTGEPVILLKRIWNGLTCDCVDLRKQTPKMRSCQDCYGTTYEGGFTQFDYLRRGDRRILVSFDESPEDLFYGEKEGLQQDYEPSGWTLPQPAIRDRDLLVRFDLTEDRTFMYEVLNVSRELIFNRRYGRQKLTLKRLDKTDVVYTFPLDLSKIP